MPCNKCTEFCKNTLHKSYNFTTCSNITIERTLHKIIITHITFIFTKRSFFKQIDTQLQCRHLGCHTAVAATRARAPTRLAPRPLVPSWWPPVLPSLERSRHRRTRRRNRRSGQHCRPQTEARSRAAVRYYPHPPNLSIIHWVWASDVCMGN